MPSMITKCPGCGRNGIMSKATGTCCHCNRGASTPKPKVDVQFVASPGVKILPARTPAPAPAPAAARTTSKPTRGPRLVGGRIVR